MARLKRAKARINLRVWSEIFEQFKAACKNRGVTMTKAINIEIEDILQCYQPKSEQQMYLYWLRKAKMVQSNDESRLL
jgi:hypothetical protein